jgi:hypothetical protein
MHLVAKNRGKTFQRHQFSVAVSAPPFQRQPFQRPPFQRPPFQRRRFSVQPKRGRFSVTYIFIVIKHMIYKCVMY